MSELNREQIVIEIQYIIKALKVNKGWWENRGRGGWFNHDILEDSLSLIKELTEENKAWQMQLISQEEKASKAYYDLACEVEDLRAENANLHASCTELTQKCASLTEENERLRGIGVPDNKAYIKLSEAKTAIMNYAGEQTVSKYATSELCKAVRDGAEGAMNELDYLPAYNVAPIADTVRKMVERLKEGLEHYPQRCGDCFKEKVDQIAKEMLEE